MFEHSIRVPRHFKIAANIVKKVFEEGGSVKTLLYDNKLKHFRTNVLYALINETIKHARNIEKVFENTGILVKEPRLDPWLARVLTAELLYGKKTLPGKSKPEQTILSYRELFEKFTSELQDDEKSKVVRRPRYVRINTNLLTTSDAIRAFQDEGYKFIRCTSGSYNEYLQQIQNLTEYDFTQDYHVKTMFVFSPGTKFHEHDLYYEKKIILQDKATALPVHLLAAPIGSVVLDMCAAPGMKTTQLAAYLRNQGKIYAVEINEERYKTLCQYVEVTGSTCVETLCKDSLQIRKGDLDDVEYILLDPSCSGSGMDLSIHNYVEETRLAKLTSLQEKFLKHAMNSFPNAKRIVYSTCSVFPEENERVVTNIVKASRAKWRVQDIKELLKDQWNNFGSGMYGSVGTRCLYAKPETDFTTGFFVAVLDREWRDNENAQVNGNKNFDGHKQTNEQKLKNENLNSIEYEDELKIKQCVEEEYSNVGDKAQKNKKNKKIEYRDNLSNTIECDVTKNEGLLEDINNEPNCTKTIKKCRKEDDDSLKNTVSYQNADIHVENTSYNEFKKSKKKKHKSKVKNGGETTDATDEPQKIIRELKVSNIEITKNKKKKVHENSEDLETVGDNQLLENNDETDVPKKKRKERKVHNEPIEETITNVCEDRDNLSNVIKYDITKHKAPSEDSNYEHTTTEISKKRLKLKDNALQKLKANDENITHCNETMNTSDVNNEFSKSKKIKHKSKVRDEVRNEKDITDTSVEAHVIPRELEVSETETTKNRKKKARKSSEDASENQPLENNNEIGVNLLEKKKKKRKAHNEETEEVVTKESEHWDRKDKKSKKIKKHDNSNMLQSQLTPEIEVTEEKKIKNKKKKSNDKDVDKLEINQLCDELPKKKKKRESNIS